MMNRKNVGKTFQDVQTAVAPLRWLETVSSTYILMGRYNHSLSLDATINFWQSLKKFCRWGSEPP